MACTFDKECRQGPDCFSHVCGGIPTTILSVEGRSMLGWSVMLRIEQVGFNTQQAALH